MTNDPASTSWHLDKRIPVAMIFAILGQAGALIFWGATISQRVTYIEGELRARAPIVERSLQTESDLRSLRLDTTSRLDRIENKLDRLIESGVPARRLPTGEP